MGRYLGPKNRIARRFGANIFGRLRNPLLHKQHPPGVHGARRRKKSDFGMQLNEKQKLKAFYGMLSEKQLINYYRVAVTQKGNTMNHLLQLLEGRLDVVVHRLKFATTIFQAGQLVSHGHILVDGRKVDIRSFQVKPGMVISIKEKSRKIPGIRNSMELAARSVPEYLSVNQEQFSGQLVSLPTLEQVSFPLEINVPVVCEFLAHNH